MEKLIELLETFEKEKVEKLKSDVWKNDTISPRIWSKSDVTIYNKLQVISKEYGFIKRLVENDKINFYEGKYLENPIGSNNYDECDYLELIQWLAISDTPIKDLIYYLK